MKKHLEYISNGLGAPSMLMLALACEGVISASVSITADTGSENDRVLNTGERVTARQYYETVVCPLAKRGGIEARFVRAVDGNGLGMPDLHEVLRRALPVLAAGKSSPLHVPMFGSNEGRYKQTCTDRFKITAIRQEVRRIVGNGTARGAQGIHADEAWRRVKGEYVGDIGGFATYRTPTGKKRKGVAVYSKSRMHYYPFVDMRLNRAAIYAEMDKRGIPYLISSECDMCPHKDAPRWLRTSPETLAEVAAIEALAQGKFFFTSRRIPLLEAVALMREETDRQPSLFDGDTADFGCDTGICGV